MINDKDSVISAMRYNIGEKEKYIRCLEEELYQLKKVIVNCSPIIKKYQFQELAGGEDEE